MRKAVIDLGTNTFNLLIADVHEFGFDIVFSEKDGVALGMGGINNNYLADEAYQRGISTLEKFAMICQAHKVEVIHGIGTSALRDAVNANDFLAEVKRKLGISIEIVTGLREAELIYGGVKWSYDFSEPAVIMDIGGGSTEFIFADNKGISDMISLNIGVSRIYQRFTVSDPLSESDVQAIENWLDEKAGVFFKNKQSDLMIGASGSFETFYEMIHNEKFPEKVKAVEIDEIELRKSLDWIMKSTQAERDSNDWIIPIRKKMAPLAAIKTRWIMDKLAVKRILISPCSLKEGAFVM